MKKQIIFCLVIGLLFAPFLYAADTSTESDETKTMQQTSKLDLQGELRSKGSGFRSGADPVVAELLNSILLIRFQKDVGVLQVTVTGPQGDVYATTVNTETPSVLSVPLIGLPSGNYSVSFCGEAGVMWGEFEV